VCATRCEWDGRPNAGPVPLEALPNGDCHDEGHKCGIMYDTGCTTHAMSCACRDGKWGCGIDIAGAGVCRDGGFGMDAGRDSAADAAGSDAYADADASVEASDN